MKSRLNSWSSWFAMATVGLFSSFAVQATLIVNGGFEEPVLSRTWEYRNGDELTGWRSFSTSQGIVHI